MDAIAFHSKVVKKFDDHYFKSTLFRERYHVWTSTINKYLKPGDCVLDAGCGNGILSFFIAKKGNSVFAIDGSSEMISLCRERQENIKNSNLEFCEQIMPFTGQLENRYDFIISSSVLEYINDYKLCLDNFKALLNPNGIVIISLPNRISLYRKTELFLYRMIKKPKYFKYVKNLSTVEELNQLMNAMGLEVLENGYFSSNSLLNKFFDIISLSKKDSSPLFLGVYRKPPR